MVKYFMLLVCAIFTMQAGNTIGGCLRRTAEGAETFVKEEVANGDAEAALLFVANKTANKIINAQDPAKLAKYSEKYKVDITQTAEGKDFSVLGQKVGTLPAEGDTKDLMRILAPHVLASLKTAAAQSASSSSSQPSPDPAPQQ